jgi:competence protein ComEA
MGTPQPTTSTPAPSSPGPHARRSAQVALATFLAVLLGLLAFRGYGTRLGARPTEHVPAAVRQVDLNRAEPIELEQVDGIGPKLARAIDDHRRERGPFRTVDDLHAVHGFGPATVNKVRPFVRVEAEPAADQEPLRLERKPAPAAPTPTGTAIRKLQPGDPPIDVNAASEADLQRLPGVGPVTARNIVLARPFNTVDDLDRVKGIGPRTLEKVRPFVVVK